ncbi:hypothetical protein CLOM_g24010 [Closterium sp. NIES-68]|nr:hypothetical protein CLOM_g24010 [Closterium sp. NIES-68]GJP78790.1 hypothetical protein CLOP_g9063 [Closterium sp. NIES-67]
MATAPEPVIIVPPAAPVSEGDNRAEDHALPPVPPATAAEGMGPLMPVVSGDGSRGPYPNVNGDGNLVGDGGMDGIGGTAALEEGAAGLDQSVATPMSARKRAKRAEVFVGGLDKGATEDDVKRVFGRAGQIAHVRLPRDAATGRNKGYCFVQYASDAAARRAAAELDRILVRGRPVGVLGGEQEDTLFIGNINKTWSKDKIEEALAGYGVGPYEALTFMADPQHAGHNRGFAFLEFASHRQAAAATMRLQQPGVSLGVDRPPRVAWADPLNEPDQHVMAQVKSIFVDGMPPSWDEPRAAGFFGRYGEIERVVLARNLPSARRHDYGFINYSSREAALAAIAALNGSQVVDGQYQMKMRVTLAKPQDRKPRAPASRGDQGGRLGGAGVGAQEGGSAGSAAAAVEAALANESTGGGEGGKEGEGGGGGEAVTGVTASVVEREREGGKNSVGVNRFECAVCVFGSDDEGEYLAHQLSRAHAIVSTFRHDLKLANKTPLSVLNEFAMRNKIAVEYDLKGDPAGPFDASAALGGGPNAIPWVRGEARAGMKLRAKQMAAGAAVESLLLAGVAETEFTRPGQARLKQMGRKGAAGGRGAPAGVHGGGRGAYGVRGGGDRGRGEDRAGGGYGGWSSGGGGGGGGLGGYGALGVYGGGTVGTGLGEVATGESYAERLGRIQGRHYVMRTALPAAAAAMAPLAPPAAGMGAGAGGYGAPSAAYTGPGAAGAAYGGQYGGGQYSAVQYGGAQFGGTQYVGSKYEGSQYSAVQYGGSQHEGQYGRAEGVLSGVKRPYPAPEAADAYAAQRARSDPSASSTRTYSIPLPAPLYSAPPPPHPYSTPPPSHGYGTPAPAHPYTHPPPPHAPTANLPPTYPSAHTYPSSYSYPFANTAPYAAGGVSAAPAPPPALPPHYQQPHQQPQQGGGPAAAAGSGSTTAAAERAHTHAQYYSTQQTQQPYSQQQQPPPKPYQPPYQQPQQQPHEQKPQQPQQQQQQQQQPQQQQQAAAGGAERGGGAGGGGHQQQGAAGERGGREGYGGVAVPPSSSGGGGYGAAYGGVYGGLYPPHTHAATTAASPPAPAAHSAAAPPAQSRAHTSAGQSPAPAGGAGSAGGAGGVGGAGSAAGTGSATGTSAYGQYASVPTTYY